MRGVLTGFLTDWLAKEDYFIYCYLSDLFRIKAPALWRGVLLMPIPASTVNPFFVFKKDFRVNWRSRILLAGTREVILREAESLSFKKDVSEKSRR